MKLAGWWFIMSLSCAPSHIGSPPIPVATLLRGPYLDEKTCLSHQQAEVFGTYGCKGATLSKLDQPCSTNVPKIKK